MSAKRRIVSLVPSLTETVCDFGLQSELVGCTTFCVHPTNLRTSIPSIGGTKDASVEKIAELRPTHILVNTEENLPETIRALKQKTNAVVIETFPKTPQQSIQMVSELANVFCYDATQWTIDCLNQIKKLKLLSQEKIFYLYFIWRNPWMVAGNQTYIASMLDLIGFQSKVETSENLAERYPVLQADDQRVYNSDVLLFSSEPYPFKQRHVDEFLSQANIKKPIQFVDGQMLSWFGTRTLAALRYVEELRITTLS